MGKNPFLTNKYSMEFVSGSRWQVVDDRCLGPWAVCNSTFPDCWNSWPAAKNFVLRMCFFLCWGEEPRWKEFRAQEFVWGKVIREMSLWPNVGAADPIWYPTFPINCQPTSTVDRRIFETSTVHHIFGTVSLLSGDIVGCTPSNVPLWEILM